MSPRQSSCGCCYLLKRLSCQMTNVKYNGLSHSGRKLFAEKLDSRGLVRVSGADSWKFLQGLVTNDVNLLETSPALYAMMLNVQVCIHH